jgi:hypothetical protein
MTPEKMEEAETEELQPEPKGEEMPKRKEKAKVPDTLPEGEGESTPPEPKRKPAPKPEDSAKPQSEPGPEPTERKHEPKNSGLDRLGKKLRSYLP